MSLSGTLLEAMTSDQLRLHGYWQVADPSRPPGQRLWLMVHGVAGNFYGSSLLQALADGLLQRGEDVLRINTRGHDPVAYIPSGQGRVRVGAAYEMIADAHLDLLAWVERARALGYQQVGLLGHSLGAIKVGHFASLPTELPPLAFTICVSPPRLNHRILQADERYAATFHEQYQEAKERMQQGKPEALMTIRYPQPMLISAATFLDKYGGDTHDYFGWAERIRNPCLWTFGELEVLGQRPSFRGCDAALRQALSASSNHRVATLASADHSYNQGRGELVKLIQWWIDSTDPPV